MHFQFLIEDQSTAALIGLIMKNVIRNFKADSFDCIPFHGIGGITKTNSVKEMRTGKLLNDLAGYMRGFQKSLEGIPAVLFVVLDLDDKDYNGFVKELEGIAALNNITMDHVFCLAVEEVEAWLLGDENAIRVASPKYKKSVLSSYIQDSICGTWEKLADVVFKGGVKEIKNQKLNWKDVGKLKTEWALNIGKYMNYKNNRSPSFQNFMNNVVKRLSM